MSTTNSEQTGPWTAYLPPEVWTCIGDQIQSRETLRRLVAVCRTFRTIFTPFLYARHTLCLTRWTPLQLADLLLPNGLNYTREFEIHLPSFDERRITYNVGMNRSYALFVVKMLERMPDLQAFRWIDSTFQEENDPSLILRNRRLLNMLKGCTTLKNISIMLPFIGDLPRDRAMVLKNQIHLGGFRNLTSLELYGFHAAGPRATKDIATVLWESPGLKTLCLAMACGFDNVDDPEIITLDPHSNFFEDLCKLYASKANTSPLALETLRLGHGVFFEEPESPSAENYLVKLIRPAILTKLHVYNGWVRFEPDELEETLNIGWSLLTGCKSLRQLSVSRLEPEVGMWLSNDGQSVQELIVTEHYTRDDPGLMHLNNLRLPQLNMLCVYEKSLSTDENMSDTGSARSFALEYGDTISVLDRLFDGGSTLTRLHLSLSIETQWEQFTSHLPKLKNLTHLRLSKKSHKVGQFPKKSSSLWPGVTREKDLAHEYAKLIFAMCPPLELIRIRTWAWQRRDSGAPSESQSPEVVETRELEKEEILNIELFAIRDFAEQSGLAINEDLEHFKEISDEQQARADRIIIRINEAFRAGLVSEDGQLPEGWMDEFTDGAETV